MGHFHLKCNMPAPHEERAKVASSKQNNLSLDHLIVASHSHPISGLFSNTSPRWLITKLERHLMALQANPRDADTAFDFFVTAESVIDWMLPGRANKLARRQLHDSESLLQVVSHIASGAKHFAVEAPHHRSVRSTRRTGGLFSGGLFAGRMFAGRLVSKGGLTVELDDEPAKLYGTSVAAVSLAELVLERLKALVIERNPGDA